MTKNYSYMCKNQCEIHLQYFKMVPEYDTRTSSSFSKALFQFKILNIYLYISMSIYSINISFMANTDFFILTCYLKVNMKVVENFFYYI